MVPGVAPREASDRLIICQNQFDILYKKFLTYTGGEELFGLPVTEYPELLKIKKELNLLQKLYGLYNAVIDTVHGYYDILWADINIEKINNELLEFQNKLVNICFYKLHKVEVTHVRNTALLYNQNKVYRSFYIAYIII